MSQITLQGKQQALMRVAASRVAVLDAVGATQKHANGCVRALPVSPAVLMRIGAAAGAAASVMGTLAGLRHRRKVAEKAAVASGTSVTSVKLILQLLSPVILPVLQSWLQKTMSRNQKSSGQDSMF